MSFFVLFLFLCGCHSWKKTPNNKKNLNCSRPPDVETGCEPGSNLLFLSEISNQCCPGCVRWCFTLLFFMACRLSGTSVGGGVKYFGRRGIMEVQQAWIRKIKAWKKVVSSFLAAHIFSGLTASFALCKGRLASREDYSFFLTAGYGWMAVMAKLDESFYQKKKIWCFRLSSHRFPYVKRYFTT